MSDISAQPQENKMGVMPINRLLISMSLPMMLSMLIQSLYNIVDSVFVSRIDEYALTAVSMVFPIQNLMIAIGSGTAVGINALLSKSLGEKNFEEANRAAKNGIFLAIVTYAVFAICGICFSNLFIASQTDIKEIIEYASQYTFICLTFSFGVFGQFTFERLLQSTGKTFYVMITQGTGAIINIILDPILIFGLCGFPALGVRGAAAATVIGQICAMLLAIYFNAKKNGEISIGMRGFKPSAKTIKRIYAVGLPSIVMVAIGSVMTYGLNSILMTFSSTAVAVFGVYFKLQSFVFMPVFGLNNGMIPIISYNYGAQKRTRITRTIKLSVLYAVCIMLIGLAIFQLFPTALLRLFDASDYMLSIGVTALRTISICFIFAGFCIVSGSVFQALGNGVLSLIVSLVRQLIILLPTAYLLSRSGVLDYVWRAFPIAEISAAILSAVFLRKIYKDKILPIRA